MYNVNACPSAMWNGHACYTRAHSARTMASGDSMLRIFFVHFLPAKLKQSTGQCADFFLLCYWLSGDPLSSLLGRWPCATLLHCLIFASSFLAYTCHHGKCQFQAVISCHACFCPGIKLSSSLGLHTADTPFYKTSCTISLSDSGHAGGHFIFRCVPGTSAWRANEGDCINHSSVKHWHTLERLRYGEHCVAKNKENTIRQKTRRTLHGKKRRALHGKKKGKTLHISKEGYHCTAVKKEIIAQQKMRTSWKVHIEQIVSSAMHCRPLLYIQHT